MKKGKVIFISGASSGLGKGIARGLLVAGYRVYGGYHKTTSSKDSGINYVKLDVTSDLSCEQAVKKILSKESRIDILINCAGISPTGPTLDFTAQQFLDTLQVNTVGPFRLIKEIVPVMGKRGLIINITSLNGYLSLPHSGIYSASKFGLEALTFALRQELAKSNIRLISVAPGAFVKEISDTKPMSHPPAREKFPILKWLFPFTPQKKVVEIVVGLVEKSSSSPRIIIGPDAWVTYLLLKTLPLSWLDKLIRLIWQKRGSLAFRS